MVDEVRGIQGDTQASALSNWVGDARIDLGKRSIGEIRWWMQSRL